MITMKVVFEIVTTTRLEIEIVPCDGKMCGQGVYVGRAYVCPHNNLAAMYPDLMKEWHPTKNGLLDPSKLAVKCSKMVWWKCPNGACECHEYEAKVYSRTNGTGCPFCTSKKVCIHDNLAAMFPQLAEEWHPSLNGDLKPTDVSPWSNKTAWWKCKNGVCGCHEYMTIVRNRTMGHGCPFCNSGQPCPHNNLAVRYPSLCLEWHPRLNGTLKPTDVTPGSDKKVWWICAKGHEWPATIDSRTRGRGCGSCTGNGYSKAQIDWLQSIAKEQNLVIYHAENMGERYIQGVGYVDGYCYENNTVYEYHGSYWHGNPERFDPQEIHPTAGKTYGQLYQETLARDEKIRSLGYTLQVKWGR